MRNYVPLRETNRGLLRLKGANAWVWLCGGVGYNRRFAEHALHTMTPAADEGSFLNDFYGE